MGVFDARSYREENGMDELCGDERAVVEMFFKAKLGVVNILSLTKRDLAVESSGSNAEAPKGTGTGFVWDDLGHIVTNNHVINDAAEIRVRTASLPDDKYFTADLVGADEERDVAILRLEAESGLQMPDPLVRVKAQQQLFVGQKVFAIGNPFGLEHTLTTGGEPLMSLLFLRRSPNLWCWLFCVAGVISGLGREITRKAAGRPMFNIIQTDAAVNPGNSGGPLLNSRGFVIGMNSAIASPSGVFAGVGFAIPASTLETVVREILSAGHVMRPALGVFFAPEALCRRLGIEDGLLVLGTRKAGAAEKAGLKSTKRDASGKLHLGDVVVKLDGNKTDRIVDIFRHLDRKKVRTIRVPSMALWKAQELVLS
mmetsp:Transcript_25249/g.99684  ORF Transcript_25249/g.99684 Transcript_25249/m.99684 type:complete len:369 (-) Transcript_25249:617-1723(-)